MARRPKQAPGSEENGDPRGFAALGERYFERLRITAYSELTISKRREFLGRFAGWCAERAVLRPSEVTKPILERYQRHLYQRRKKDGQPLSFSSQLAELVAVRGFFHWLCQQHYILFNPAAELELPRRRRRLPKHVLSVAEVEQVLAQPEVRDPLGVRDRAILETLYSTGLRRTELIRLELYDLDAQRGLVTVRLGKGGKDRVVPIGERAVRWIERYRLEVRPSLLVQQDETTLFLGAMGEALSPSYVTCLVHGYVEAAQIGKSGACHLLRHTMATLMLEAGADIRFIQQMLGHEELSSTQIYTHVSVRALKQVHTATHPARPKRPAAGSEGPAAEATPAGDAPRREEDEEEKDAQELFSSLAAEENEEDLA